MAYEYDDYCDDRDADAPEFDGPDYMDVAKEWLEENPGHPEAPRGWIHPDYRKPTPA